MAIARGATQTQIIDLGVTSGAAWDDMVYLKCHPHHLLRAQAVCAPALRGGHDRLAERLRDTGHVSSFEQAERIGGFRFH